MYEVSFYDKKAMDEEIHIDLCGSHLVQFLRRAFDLLDISDQTIEVTGPMGGPCELCQFGAELGLHINVGPLIRGLNKRN